MWLAQGFVAALLGTGAARGSSKTPLDCGKGQVFAVRLPDIDPAQASWATLFVMWAAQGFVTALLGAGAR